MEIPSCKRHKGQNRLIARKNTGFLYGTATPGATEIRQDTLFSLKALPKSTLFPFLSPFVAAPLENLLGFPYLNMIYRDILQRDNGRWSVEKACEALKITYEIPEQDLSSIPCRGLLIVIYNHSFGVIEGIILAQILRSVRTDVKFMANYLLSRIPEIRLFQSFPVV